MKSTVLVVGLTVACVAAVAAESAKTQVKVKDYVRKELKVSSLPPSVKVYEWTHKKGMPGRAWVAKFDLKDPKLRFVTRLGLYNDRSATNRLATVGEMAAALVAEGRNPIVGINGNYFDAQSGSINLYGPIVSDGKVLIPGGGNLLVETEDHAFTLGGGNSIGGKGALSADGKKILNATGFYMEPTIRYARGEYKTTDNPAYPRTLIGLGEKMLAFLVSDGRQPLWSLGVDDRAAVDMLVSEGCHTVAEGDGGGSTSMWIKDLPKKLTARDKDYINKSSDGRPRKVGEGVFMLYDTSTADARKRR